MNETRLNQPDKVSYRLPKKIKADFYAGRDMAGMTTSEYITYLIEQSIHGNHKNKVLHKMVATMVDDTAKIKAAAQANGIYSDELLSVQTLILSALMRLLGRRG